MWQEIENLIQLSRQPLPDEIDPARNPERRNYYRFLYHLVKWRRPYTVLEIGVEGGLASAYMTMAAWECRGRVIGVDHENKITVPIGQNFHFVEGDSTNIRTWAKVGALVQDFGKIGIVYQDSSHHYEASKREWDLYQTYLDDKAIWICDDITPAFHDPLIDPPGKGMVQYFEELPGDKRLYQDVLHYGNCQGVVIL